MKLIYSKPVRKQFNTGLNFKLFFFETQIGREFEYVNFVSFHLIACAKSGEYAGHSGTVESNGYQRTVDYPDEWRNGFHVMLDTGVLVTVRWEQVEGTG